MEFLQKGKKGKQQDFLIYGKEYKIYRDGNFLGKATYTDDSIHGDVFIMKIIQDGKECLAVPCVDHWILSE
jgi:hypothetical protein